MEVQELDILEFLDLAQGLQDPNNVTNDTTCVFSTGHQGNIRIAFMSKWEKLRF